MREAQEPAHGQERTESDQRGEDPLARERVGDARDCGPQGGVVEAHADCDAGQRRRQRHGTARSVEHPDAGQHDHFGDQNREAYRGQDPEQVGQAVLSWIVRRDAEYESARQERRRGEGDELPGATRHLTASTP